MKKETIVKLIAGLELTLEALREEAGMTPSKEVVAEAPKETKKTEKTPVKEEKTVAEEAPKANDREAELTAMAFNDLKKYAKEIGVSATGTKAQIVAKVLDAEATINTAQEEEIVEDSPVEVSDAKEADDTTPDDAGEETLADKVARELEGTSDAELKEILASVDIKAIGKRQTLLDKIVKAIEEGKLDFGDDDENADADENGSNEATDDGDEIPGSPERLKAMDALYAELRKSYDNKETTDKEIAEFLKKYYDGKPPKASKEEKLEDYLAIQVSLIDDDGEQHDLEDAYYVGDVVYCCGAPVKELDNGNVVCEICGQEYEI